MSALPSLPSGESSKEGSGAQPASWPPSRPVPAPPRPRDHLGTPAQPDAPLSTAPAPLHHSPAPPQNQDPEPQPASSVSPRRAGAVPDPSLSARGCSHRSPASTSGPCPCQGAGNHVPGAARGCANAAGMAAPEAATRTCVGHPVPKPLSEAWRSRAARPLPPLLASCRCEEKPAVPAPGTSPRPRSSSPNPATHGQGPPTARGRVPARRRRAPNLGLTRRQCQQETPTSPLLATPGFHLLPHPRLHRSGAEPRSGVTPAALNPGSTLALPACSRRRPRCPAGLFHAEQRPGVVMDTAPLQQSKQTRSWALSSSSRVGVPPDLPGDKSRGFSLG